MDYTLLNEERAKQVRERFESTFIETPEEYMASALKWREEYFSNNPNAHVYPIPNYDKGVYWSKIKCCEEISFTDALSFLSKTDNDVYFMSDPELEGYFGMHLLNWDSNSIGFVAVHNAPKEFAEFIYDEWKRSYTVDYENEEEWFDPLLPDDLYVFDESFSWMLVFTHHNVDDFAPDRVENSYNRLCFLLRA